MYYIEEAFPMWQCFWCGWEMDYRYRGQNMTYCSNVCKQQHKRFQKNTLFESSLASK